jgi:hypothetical protein
MARPTTIQRPNRSQAWYGRPSITNPQARMPSGAVIQTNGTGPAAAGLAP